jgi:Tfp pilus assembly protein FimV
MAALNEAVLQQMQEQITQMQTELPASAAATATAAAAAAATAALNALPPDGAPAGGNPGFPPLAPVFTLSLSLVNAGAFLDLNSISGAKLFKSGAQLHYATKQMKVLMKVKSEL